MTIPLSLEVALARFKVDFQVGGAGALGTVLVLTRKAMVGGLPFDPEKLLTPGGGQVAGLSGANINKILAGYGVTQQVGTESGRTSRGTPALAGQYAAFLHALPRLSASDIADIEAWWVSRFTDYFNSAPFKLNYDSSKTLASVIRNLLDQALERQKKSPGKTYVGAVLQHLVGAKLELALPALKITHNGASVADAVSARSGDFVIDNAIIHCTTAPSEALMRKCEANLKAGQHPIILTIAKMIGAAEGLAENAGIEGRVEVMDALQFLAANLYEMSLFKAADRKVTVIRLIEKYNQIVAAHEADASLRISFD
ncbi:DUF4928 family protein [Actimicrobium sp. CCC2.4]|uniref:DUF4928 family protein n=1 Tax=Actimicrobium sp. CCC2.4 TaxID=3048606 RepID=UPI002AC8FE72|nr:DUF4928 family protein [Actimicrobium sp. CCC2.4]MEB0135708.1 DUF4928 family protein [Actimicrobium sp. CCC2.4]WPX33734.1 DUF4928 family protein [Actimicrobium sp. CCC2.4]